MPKHRTVSAAFAALAVAPALVVGDAATAHAAFPQPVVVHDHFRPFADGVVAVTYDPAVPAGSHVAVGVVPEPTAADTLGIHPDHAQTEFWVSFNGLLPSRAYSAHLATGACGASPADAGPRYQNLVDPVQPSGDPLYANPANEMWLDLTSDESGTAAGETTVPWRVRPGEARSIVVHGEHTHTLPGIAGQAGARLACVNLPL
ncbi:hypothetical protein [Marinactinospora rubrisoli]|uniref:Superoxide dismutase n=1 Tax=Marinactinospora rubrisoli TaxID=2715399 RepID=A0ABW2KA95_9ACTN